MIIVDTSALFSLLIETDKNHSLAIKTIGELQEDEMVLPHEIFAELINVIGKKFDHQKGFKVGQFILESKTFILRESATESIDSAIKRFQKQPKGVSFTDCLVMAFADEFETKDIFGFDEAFHKNGYKRLGID